MFDKYPYTDFHELNLDYILKRVKEMGEEIQAFYEYIDQHFLTSFNTRTGDVVPEAGDYNAQQITFDNTGTGLTAANVQDAITEVNAAIPSQLPAEDVTYDNAGSGLTATNVQAAVDELAAAPAPDLDDLGDVTITTPANDDVLKYDSNAGEWVNGPGSAGASALDDLTDVTISTPSNGQVLSYDSNAGEWVNSSAGSSTIAGLTDVTITSPQNGQVLNYDGVSQTWVNGNAGSNALASLSDVSITTPADGEVLTYDNVNQEWINAAIPTPAAPAASAVSYDNSGSGLTASNVQDAIDEVAAGGSVPAGLLKYEGTDSVTYGTTATYRSVLWNLRNLMVSWFTNHPGKYVRMRYMLLLPNNTKVHLTPFNAGLLTAWDDESPWYGAGNNDSNKYTYSPANTEAQNWYAKFGESDGTRSDYSGQNANNGGTIYFDVFSLTT